MKPKRKSNWPAALHLFLEEKDKQPLRYGENDCCLFVSDWVCILMGYDPAAEFRGTYSTAAGAMRILAEFGNAEEIAEQAAVRWNWVPVPVLRAQRGDIVSHPGELGPALGVCAGELSAFPVGPGVKYFNTSDCRRAWRVE
jgi:hypothetical protein